MDSGVALLSGLAMGLLYIVIGGHIFTFTVGIKALARSYQQQWPLAITPLLLACNLCEPFINVLMFLLAFTVNIPAGILLSISPTFLSIFATLGLRAEQHQAINKRIFVLSLVRTGTTFIVLYLLFSTTSWMDQSNPPGEHALSPFFYTAFVLHLVNLCLNWYSGYWGSKQLNGPLGEPASVRLSTGI